MDRGAAGFSADTGMNREEGGVTVALPDELLKRRGRRLEGVNGSSGEIRAEPPVRLPPVSPDIEDGSHIDPGVLREGHEVCGEELGWSGDDQTKGFQCPPNGLLCNCSS